MHVRGIHNIHREVADETYTLTVHTDLERTTDQGYLSTATLKVEKDQRTATGMNRLAETLFVNTHDMDAKRSTITGTIALTIREATQIIEIEAAVAAQL